MTQASAPRFGAVLTAMVTPFDDNKKLDLGGAQELAQWLVANGSDGLVIAGTTGESATLTHDEHIDLIAAVVEAVDVPVVAGTGSNDTATAVSTTQRATGVGATAVLLVTPYYNRPSQAGLLQHFRAIAEATDLPVVLYDIPARTGRKVETDTMLELAHGVTNIVGLKDAAGDPAETASFISQAPKDFDVYSGDDNLTLPLLAVGAKGVIGVATHWVGVQMGEMIAAFNRGDIDRARELNRSMMESYTFATKQPDIPSPAPAKAIMSALGLPAGPCRPPMDATPDHLENGARLMLSRTPLGAELAG